MPEPVVVFRARSEIEASVVRALLDAHGIQARLSSHAAEAAFPASIDGLGGVQVAVRAEDAEDAARLIASARGGEPRGLGPPMPDEVEALEAAMGYRFRDRGLLEHALTHRSRANEDVTGGVFDNESLEFLGDAVLGFVIADMLFRRFPERDEGQKSKLKATLVSATALSRRAEALDVGRHLLLGRGEEKSGGRSKPALLADTYEALIAALYLDGGIDAARRFIDREFGDAMAEAGRSRVVDDHKSELQESLQARGLPLPDYVVADEQGPAHQRVFVVDVRVAGEVVARGEGRTKKEAEQDAARRARARFSG
jgi:ribonuclease-3